LSGDGDRSPEERSESGTSRSIEKDSDSLRRVSPRRSVPNGKFVGDGAHSISPSTSHTYSFQCELENCECGGQVFSSKNGAQQLIEHMYAQVAWLACDLWPWSISN